MKNRFFNKNAVVTGAGSGIGKEVAIKLLEGGASVCLVGRSKKIESVYKKINLKYKKKTFYYIADLAEETDVANLSKYVSKIFKKKIDILINCAGITGPGNISNLSLDEWQKIHNNNGTNTFLTCKYFIPFMKKKNYGKIVNVSSIAGRFRGRTSGLHYAYSKSGIIGFTRQLGAEVAPWGINVNCFCPSQTMTTMLKSLINKKIKKELENTIPLKRIAEPSEQANVILFLVSDESSYIAASIVDSNGGQF